VYNPVGNSVDEIVDKKHVDKLCIDSGIYQQSYQPRKPNTIKASFDLSTISQSLLLLLFVF